MITPLALGMPCRHPVSLDFAPLVMRGLNWATSSMNW
jgi:hypothetical protein